MASGDCGDNLLPTYLAASAALQAAGRCRAWGISAGRGNHPSTGPSHPGYCLAKFGQAEKLRNNSSFYIEDASRKVVAGIFNFDKLCFRRDQIQGNLHLFN